MMHRCIRVFFCPSERGLSLVELMVSMLLGLILSGGIISVYLGANRHYYYDDQLARIQENGRYAMRLLSRELGMAGFFGGILSMEGVSPAAVGRDCSESDWALDGSRELDLVNDYSGSSAPVSLNLTILTCLDSTSIETNTDLITIKRTAAGASLYRGEPAAALTASTIEKWYLRVVSGGDPHWEKLRPLDLFDPAHAGSSLSYWEAISRIFFIRKYSGADEGDGIPSLCMETLAGDAMTLRCLVEGVENMQLEFGIDTDADGVPNRYKAAPTSDEMQHVVTVKIYLLLRSVNTISGYRDDKTYALGQKHLAAKHDGYLRRVFSTTVRLRNRIKPIG